MKLMVVSMMSVAGLIFSLSAMAIEMPALAEKNFCTSCHTIEKRKVGPAWRAVSNKYKGATKYTYEGKEYPLLEGLVMKVSHGGKGNWGTMPMPANDPNGIKQDEITELVKFVLSLAK